MAPCEKHSWKQTVLVMHTFFGSWECPLMRASTSCTTFLKPSETNDINIITSLQSTTFICAWFTIFYDLIHWRDKPLERWQLCWCLLHATFFDNDCFINLPTCTWTLLCYITPIYHSSQKTENKKIHILESNNGTCKQYFVTTVFLKKER